MKTIVVAGYLSSALFAMASEASLDNQTVAAEIPKNDQEQEWPLSGDWGGYRGSLREHGIDLYAGYLGEYLGNVSGGIRRGAVYHGLLELGLNVATEKAGWWRGGQFHFSSLYPHGPSLSQKLVGDFQTASNIDAYDSFRLYEAYYEHLFFADRFSLRLGQLTADEEFAVTESSLNFINAAFGWPTFISVNTVNTGPAYYVAASGLRLRYNHGDHLFFQAGIYDGDSFDDQGGNARGNARGTRIHLNGNQGAFAMAEMGYRTQPEGARDILPAIFRMGAWGHTADFRDLYYDDAGMAAVLTGEEARLHGGNFGVYLSAEKMVFRENESDDNQGISVFARFGGSPPERSAVEFATTAGVTWEGLIPGRNKDVWGVGVAYAQMSRYTARTEKADRDINGTRYDAISDHETAFETFYQIQITPHLTVQPDVQWILHPGGSSAISDAVVVGVRATMLF